jgi:hypothetical protein
MMRGSRRDLRPFHSELIKVFPEGIDVRLREFIDTYPAVCGLVDYPVVNIGEIENVGHFVAFIFQVSTQNVAENERTEVSNVRKIPNGRAANVHLHAAVFHRNKFLDAARERVKETEHG